MRTVVRAILVTSLVMCRSTSSAQDAPRHMRAGAPPALTSTLTHTAYRDVFAAWGRDAAGHRALCVTFHDGSTSCHSPGVVHREVSIAESVGGGLLMAGGLLTIGVGTYIRNPICRDLVASDDPEEVEACPARLRRGNAVLGAGLVIGSLGFSLTSIGIARGVQRRRAFRWLRARHAAMSVSAGAGWGALSLELSL